MPLMPLDTLSAAASYLVASAPATASRVLSSAVLLAQDPEPEKGYNVSWGIVMLCVVLGMMLTLRASKRTDIEDKPLDT
ncbi:MAG: hypothetical protein AAGG46_00650 [Planctomycetota bacterium]